MPDISLREITKAFSRVLAVDRVSVDFSAGEIHAVLGENGAGKSTLMHLLSGLYQPDAGEILLNGERKIFSSPRAASAAGIAMVHQHFMLIPPLTVAENIFLVLPGSSRERVRRSDLVKRVQALATQYGIPIDSPDAPVMTLSVGTQQRVELLKALAASAQVLILDEPTAVLTPGEVENLFTILRRLKRQGYLIILITHKIPEVLAIADRLSILRRGRLVTTRDVSTCTAHELASLMVEDQSVLSQGQTIPQFSSSGASSQLQPPLLRLDNVSLQDGSKSGVLRDVSFTVNAGEVVGIAGVDGNGQTELAELLLGLRVPVQGTIQWQGQQIIKPTPAKIRASRVSLIPQDRRREGLALTLAVEENLLLNTSLLSTFTPGRLFPLRKVRHFAEKQIAQFGIQTASPTQPVAALSGGNQQRVVIARELASNPQLIIAANPSRGLDMGATKYIHQTLLDRCRHGAGIVLISTDLDEILTLSTRVYTLYQGHLLGPVDPTSSRKTIGQMMTGARTLS